MSLFDYVVGGQPLECRLAQLATSSLSQAFAESTKRAYASMFKLFLAFFIFMSWDIYQVTVLQLLQQIISQQLKQSSQYYYQLKLKKAIDVPILKQLYLLGAGIQSSIFG